LAQIESKIVDLQAIQETLTHLVKECAGDDRPDCPILNTLEQFPMK
jgi:MerR family copper efflux transcriptional regulator